jgi:hypothetical protein
VQNISSIVEDEANVDLVVRFVFQFRYDLVRLVL